MKLSTQFFKKASILLLTLTIIFPHFLPQKAFADESISPIEVMIQKTMKNSHISSVAAAAITSNDVGFFSYGNGVDEDSLFCIGSLSKSFTGYAIIYLEEKGLISLEDPITKYIPWFEAKYNGENVAHYIRIADLLYQTSGFTNSEKQYPNADISMNLEDNARNLSGRELTFSPSEQFSYANVNYNLLGYLIEVVTGSSYAEFMEQEIFMPLGLINTYAAPDVVNESLITGTRLSFGRSWKYSLPISEGAVPAGYIISCTRDLSRWLQIHLGQIEVQPVYATVISRTHVENDSSIIDDNIRYAAGWYVNSTAGRIHHSGGTPNYSSHLVIDTANSNAACVLTNMNASVNTDDIADNIITILQNGNEMKYGQDIWTIMDNIFSTVTVAALLLIILFYIFINRRRKAEKRLGKIWFTLPVFFLVLVILCVVTLPIIFGSPWNVIIIWAPISIVAGIVLLTALFAFMFLSIWKMNRF